MVKETNNSIMEALTLPVLALLIVVCIFVKEGRSTKKIIKEHPEIKQDPIV
ncbi:hypothetical protein K2Q02_02740 [Patescibacteria group bacterium]|nr:hypothetical protein [Patescibacteria group bacterium]